MEVGWFALAVSFAAFALTWWNSRRAVKKDSVFWVQRDKVSRSGERASAWRVSIRNYGHGTAGDVRVYEMSQLYREPKELLLAPTVALGQEVAPTVDVDDMSNQTLRTLRIIVKWRQAPKFDKERSQEFHFPLDRLHTDGSG